MTIAPPDRRGWRTWGALIGALVAVGVAVRFLPVAAWLDSFNDWVGGLGAIAPVVFAAGYAVATVLFVPGSVLTFGGGAVFGFWLGMVTVWSGAMIGACASFLLGRYVARDAVSRRLAANAKFVAIDRAVAAQGGRIVLLLRLSPLVPFNALNYLLGLTSVSFRAYAFASAVGMLPGTALYVFLGHAGRAGLEAAGTGRDETDWLKLLLYGIGLVATIAVSVIVARLARNAMRGLETETAGADAAGN